MAWWFVFGAWIGVAICPLIGIGVEFALPLALGVTAGVTVAALLAGGTW